MEYRLKSPTFYGTGSTSVSVPGAAKSVSLSIKEGVVTIPADEAHHGAIRESLLKDGFIDVTDRTNHAPAPAPKERDRGERLGAVLLAPSGQFSGDTFVKTESGQKAIPVYNGASVVFDSDIEDALTREGWKPGPDIYRNDIAPEASEGEDDADSGVEPSEESEAPGQEAEESAKPPSDQSEGKVGDETGSDETAADEDIAPEASEGEDDAE